ncbi:hypothetical protein RIVM261_016690 [Rivularia sp. IAM M-261]|nr:hypothetical protein CAL7716_030900 [Calothrix sp. PCC 7716]GJD16713.1 hypothetical protein RIVM261_016690 [Rivularia sp. IAM M-261]
MLYLLLVFYILFAGLFFVRWLDFFVEDEEMSPQMRSLSTFILVLATILWPITVPFAYLELLKFHKKNKQLINLLLDLSNSKDFDDINSKNNLTDSLSFSLSNSSKFQKEKN